ncbi:putative transcription factor bHLH family [Dioscorea sansibarensis]
MDVLSARWFSEQGVDELNSLTNQWELSSLDDFIIQTYPQDHIQQCLSSSSSSFQSHATSSSITPQPLNISVDVEKPKKMLKTNSWNSRQAPDASPTSILSFTSGLDSRVNRQNDKDQFIIEDVKPKDLGILFDSNSKRKLSTKPPSYQDHIIAERKRREKLSQKFIALSSIIPNLKKMDKATVLGDAIKYVKQLQERVKTLEEETKKKKKKRDHEVSSSRTSEDKEDHNMNDQPYDDHDSIPEIEARACEKTVLIKISCQHRKGVIVKSLLEIEKLNLTVTNTSVMSFPSSSLHLSVIAQIEEEFCLTVDDVVKKLSLALRELI